MDTINCPISGKEIGEGAGIPVMSTSGNVWIVHPSTAPNERRTDPGDGPQTINGHPPIAGPDA